jgi:hypothetical protein
MLTNEPFDRSRFTRRRQVEVFGIRLNVTSPEDTILAKLRWSQLSGGSEKQFTDALRVLELQNPNLDMTYLDEWAIRLGINDEWIQLKSNADLNPS